MATAIPVTAALHCLRTMTVDKYCKDERSAEDWHKLLQSALAKVIDLAKTGEDMLPVLYSVCCPSVLSVVLKHICFTTFFCSVCVCVRH